MSGNNLSNISMSLSHGKFKHLVEVEMEHCSIAQLNASLLGSSFKRYVYNKDRVFASKYIIQYIIHTTLYICDIYDFTLKIKKPHYL